MLKVDREHRTFSRLKAPTMTESQILERADLQEWIFNSSKAFFAEIGEAVFVLGKEVIPSQTVQDRIDLLGIDPEGAAVIVELKRGSNKLQMFQAISYAGMIARWKSEDFRRLVSEETWEELIDFLDVEIDDLNHRQRLLLVAEGYDYALLAGAEWLSEQYGVDIRCSSITLANDPATQTEYLACTSIFPPPALAEQAAARTSAANTNTSTPVKWTNWEEALANIENDDLREFGRAELRANRERYLRKRGFFYRIDGKRRWNLLCRSKYAYVWQYGRFPGDENYWAARLSDPDSVEPKKRGQTLKFNLWTAEDIEAFRRAASQDLADQVWSETGFEPEATDGHDAVGAEQA